VVSSLVLGVRDEVSAAEDYKGIGFCGVDSKLRFTLPVDLRHRVRAGSGDNSLYVNLQGGTPYLTGFGKDYLDDIKAEIEADRAAARQRGEPFDLHARARESVAGVESITFDDGGRFALPDDIKSLMGITDCLFFIGAIWTFEVWSPERYLESGQGSEILQARCRAALAEWAANPKRPKP
jgi:DNA-binding transcriptional regulator/RsmH inhibitor MraZ